LLNKQSLFVGTAH